MSYELRLELKEEAPKEKILATLKEQFNDFTFCIRFDSIDSGIIATYSHIATEQHYSLYQCLYYIAYQYGKCMIDLSTLKYHPYYFYDEGLKLIVDNLSHMEAGKEFIYLIDKDGYTKIDYEFVNRDFEIFEKKHGEENIYHYVLDCTEIETHDNFHWINIADYAYNILEDFMKKCKSF